MPAIGINYKGIIMKLSRFFVIATVIITLSGCSHVSNVKNFLSSGKPPSVDWYHQALASTYKEFADKKANSMDWLDSKYFSEKSRDSLLGKDIQPERLDHWDIPERYIQPAGQARERLLLLLNEDNKNNRPRETAKLLTSFDCWLEGLEKMSHLEDTEACMATFVGQAEKMESMGFASPEPLRSDNMEMTHAPMLQPADVTPQPMHQKNAMNNGKPSDDSTYVVFFRFDKYNIDNTAKVVLKDVVKTANETPDYAIDLAGHTDSAGPKKYNMELSKKRTNSVADYLVKDGIKKESVTQKYYGETMPVVKTKDGKALKANRRVVINIKGM